MDVKEFIEQSRLVTSLYDELNIRQGFSKWTLQEHVQGLMEDLGSLTRLTMMQSELRENRFGDELGEKLKHEVCDCMWSVLRIADSLNIDIESEFPKQMNKLAERIKKENY